MASYVLIAKIFCSLSGFQKKIEELRQILSECEAFEPYAAFQRLDRASQGFLSIKSFLEFLELNGVEDDFSNELFYVLRPFDANGDDRITYRDFLNFILPQQSPTLRKICTQRPTYQVNADELLPLDIESHLTSLVSLEVELFKNLEGLKKELTETHELDLHESFALLAGEKDKSYIDLESLKNFICGQGIDINEEDLLYSMLRLDRDQDGELTYTEFVEFILPISPYTRISGNMNTTQNTSIVTVNRSLIQNDRESPHSMKKMGYFDSDQNTSSKKSVKQTKQNRIISPNTSANNMDRLNTSTNFVENYAMFGPSSRERMENVIEYGDIEHHSNRGKFSSSKNNMGSQAENYLEKEYCSNVDQEHRGARNESFGQNKYFSTNSQEKYSSPEFDRTSQFPTVRKEGHTFRPDSYELTERDDVSNLNKPTHISMNIEFSLSSLENDVEYQIKDLIEQEISIKEAVRCLMSRRDFNIIEFYRLFDEDDRGFIDVASLDEGLKELGIFVSKIELYSFFKRYDSYERGSLRFTDFCNIFTSKGHSWTLGEEGKSSITALNKLEKLTTREIFIKALILIINYESNYFLMQRLLDQINDEKIVKKIFSRLINKKLYPKLDLEDINQIAEKLGLSHFRIIIRK